MGFFDALVEGIGMIGEAMMNSFTSDEIKTLEKAEEILRMHGKHDEANTIKRVRFDANVRPTPMTSNIGRVSNEELLEKVMGTSSNKAMTAFEFAHVLKDKLISSGKAKYETCYSIKLLKISTSSDTAYIKFTLDKTNDVLYIIGSTRRYDVADSKGNTVPDSGCVITVKNGHITGVKYDTLALSYQRQAMESVVDIIMSAVMSLI